MLVAALVEVDRLALQRVLGRREVDLGRAARAATVSTARSSAPSAVRASPPERSGEQLERVVGDRRRIGDPALGVGQRAPDERRPSARGSSARSS